jgi:hypothetical protein
VASTVTRWRSTVPYRDLEQQRVQRFASRADLDAAHCTAEEREEYEPHIAFGNVVYAEVDYAEILRQAEVQAQIIVWTAATTISRSYGLGCTLSSPTPYDPARSAHIIQAKQWRAWRT